MLHLKARLRKILLSIINLELLCHFIKNLLKNHAYILQNLYKNTSKILKLINNISNRQKKDNHFIHRLDVDK